jgi:hypothetical protein
MAPDPDEAGSAAGGGVGAAKIEFFAARSYRLEHLTLRLYTVYLQAAPLRRLTAQINCACAFAAGVRSRGRQSNFNVKLL